MLTSFVQWMKLDEFTDGGLYRHGCESAEAGDCVYTRRTLLTRQPFTYQCLWQIHKAIMHTCTVDVSVWARLHVCRDCVIGLQCIDSTEVMWTVFFAPTHHISCFSPRTLAVWIITATPCLQVLFSAGKLSESSRMFLSWNSNPEMLPAAESVQVYKSEYWQSCKCSQISCSFFFTHLLLLHANCFQRTALHTTLSVLFHSHVYHS